MTARTVNRLRFPQLPVGPWTLAGARGRAALWLLFGVGLAVVALASAGMGREPRSGEMQPAGGAASAIQAGVMDPPRPAPSQDPQVEAGSSGFPIIIDLPKAQLVTVVIEDASGLRVRNLIAETLLPAGKSTITWDGLDDGGPPDKDGVVIRHRVKPGTYTARGLTQDGLRTIYEFTAYGGGNVPWDTESKTGAWLADHSPPAGAVFIPSGSPFGGGKPQVLLTAMVSETGRNLVWVGLDGTVYRRDTLWGWDGGMAAAVDNGSKKDPRFYAYLIMCWGGKNSDVILRGLTGEAGAEIAKVRPKNQMEEQPRHLGVELAVRDGLAAITLPLDDAIAFVDVKTGKAVGTAAVKAPKGVAFDRQGRLLVSSAGAVRRFDVDRSDPAAPKLGAETVLVRGLEEPRTIAFDPACAHMYVADWATSNQVKVFTPDGKPERVIGRPGGYQIGAYDEQRMHLPHGLAPDDRGQLWVAEADWLPKRVSLWDAASGAFKRATYGPPHYGGGGTLDPEDKTRFFYGEFGGTMEFKLDWEKGTSTLVAVPIRWWDVPHGTPMPYQIGPERMVRAGGHSYLVAGYQGGLRGNDIGATYLYDDKARTARPVSFIGSHGHWEWLKNTKEVNDYVMSKGGPSGAIGPLMCWTDLNGDGIVTTNEIAVRPFSETFRDREGRNTTIFGFYNWKVQPDLSQVGSWSLRIPPPTFRADGTPLYDLDKATFLMPLSAELCGWEGGGVGVIPLADGGLLQWFRTWKDGRYVWRYPVAPEQQKTPPLFPGQVVEPTRELGPPFTPPRGEGGEIICISGEKGNLYLLTTDGLFVQTLGGDMRDHPLMHFPSAPRGLDVTGHSFEDEHFHPTISLAKDGNVYLVAGKMHSSLFRIAGIDTIRRRVFATIDAGERALAGIPESMEIRPRQQQRQRLAVMQMGDKAPVVDGRIDEWAGADWVDIGSAVKGAVALGGDRLYAAWKTSEAQPLRNGVGPSNKAFAFKRGACVDLNIGPRNRRPGPDPVAGDLRLLATLMQGRPLAMLYRAVGTGAAMEFTSPVGRVAFADVRDVSDQVQLAVKDGNIELSVPMALLGVTGGINDATLGDIGYLRGDGLATVQRSYWNNLDTTMVADIPTEARLYPAHWGEFTVARMVDTTPLPAEPPGGAAPAPGLLRRMWDCAADRVPQDEPPPQAAAATAGQVDLNGLPQRSDYAVRFDGTLTAAAAGRYLFTLNSDDGSLLWIDGRLVVDNDGVHGPLPVSAPAILAAGVHRIRVGFLQRGGGAALELRWTPPGGRDEIVPASVLGHR